MYRPPCVVAYTETEDMKHNKIRTILSSRLLAVVALAVLLVPAILAFAPAYSGLASGTAYAADCPAGTTKAGVEEKPGAGRQPACLPSQRDFKVSQDCEKGACLFKKYINPIINTLAIGFGIVVVGSYILAGIDYSRSANNPQLVSASKTRIVTTTFVLVGFFVFYAAMNWLIPGGLISVGN